MFQNFHLSAENKSVYRSSLSWCVVDSIKTLMKAAYRLHHHACVMPIPKGVERKHCRLCVICRSVSWLWGWPNDLMTWYFQSDSSAALSQFGCRYGCLRKTVNWGRHWIIPLFYSCIPAKPQQTAVQYVGAYETFCLTLSKFLCQHYFLSPSGWTDPRLAPTTQQQSVQQRIWLRMMAATKLTQFTHPTVQRFLVYWIHSS